MSYHHVNVAAQSWGAKQVIGVDIDDSLIRAAWKRRRSVWSQQRPSNHDDGSKPSAGNVLKTEPPVKKRRLETEPIHEEDNEPPVAHYFPAAFEHMFGSLPIPPAEEGDPSSFPSNVRFRTSTLR